MLDGLDLQTVPSPCYVADLSLLRRNLRRLDAVRREAGCTMLLALKGFAMFGVFDICRECLDGVCASGPCEARLGFEEFRRQVHVYAPAFSEQDMHEVLRYADHVVFNSLTQWRRHRDAVGACGRQVQVGLRVNPGYSEVATEIYDPCAPNSRLGIPRSQLDGQDLTGIDGLHFHVMCEQGADVLARVLEVFERQFGDLIAGRRWINFGGGHHITRPGYDVELLVRLVRDFRQRYGTEVILEPGEASALNAGVLVATVLDIVHNGMQVAILDTSAAAHMPDTLEMPYRPDIVGAGARGEWARAYRLGDLTCLAGDVIGDSSFAEPLAVGSRIVFTDMLHYTMVKNNTFNGVKLPSIATYDPADGELRVLRTFGYEDYKTRLS